MSCDDSNATVASVPPDGTGEERYGFCVERYGWLVKQPEPATCEQ